MWSGIINRWTRRSKGGYRDAVTTAIRLSKSRFVSGLQCHKQLWWKVHEPRAPELEVEPALKHRLEQGAEVGQAARRYVPGGEYEAGFVAADTAVAVDILERHADGVALIEVKASNHVKKEHIPDVALQVHVLRQTGLRVRRAEVMHLNPACRFPDLDALFLREDVTEKVELFLPVVPGEIAAQLAMLAGPLPDVPIGEHCTKPYACPFLARCWPTLPEHHISTLYTIPHRKVEEYQARGIETIYDLPTDLELGVIHARQVKAVTTGRMVVEPSLAAALAEFVPPLAYLDFETVSYAIPRFTGCRPWENMPVQCSVHREEATGRFTHHAFLADGPEDPRPAMAELVVEACAGVKKVVAHHATFERECLKNLAAAAPRLAAELDAIEARLVDLLPLVRHHIYHPDFGGSFSIKRVLPALVPGLSYDDLEINDGETASLELMRLLFDQTLKGEERAGVRRSLLAYCERDTWAMVKLLERIRSLAGVEQLELF
jgi:predicted RecB family nuclease